MAYQGVPYVKKNNIHSACFGNILPSNGYGLRYFESTDFSKAAHGGSLIFERCFCDRCFADDTQSPADTTSDAPLLYGHLCGFTVESLQNPDDPGHVCRGDLHL